MRDRREDVAVRTPLKLPWPNVLMTDINFAHGHQLERPALRRAAARASKQQPGLHDRFRVSLWGATSISGVTPTPCLERIGKLVVVSLRSAVAGGV